MKINISLIHQLVSKMLAHFILRNKHTQERERSTIKLKHKLQSKVIIIFFVEKVVMLTFKTDLSKFLALRTKIEVNKTVLSTVRHNGPRRENERNIQSIILYVVVDGELFSPASSPHVVACPLSLVELNAAG